MNHSPDMLMHAKTVKIHPGELGPSVSTMLKTTNNTNRRAREKRKRVSRWKKTSVHCTMHETDEKANVHCRQRGREATNCGLCQVITNCYRRESRRWIKRLYQPGAHGCTPKRQRDTNGALRNNSDSWVATANQHYKQWTH